MTVALTLTNYPASSENDAALISCPGELLDQVAVVNTNSDDATAYLLAEHILRWRYYLHGWISQTNAAARFAAQTYAARVYDVQTAVVADLKYIVEKVYYPMSINFNAGETPIFFARVVDSATRAPLTKSLIDSITLTIYAYSRNNIRTTQGTGYLPVSEDWTDVELTVADVIDDDPTTDERCGFAPNLIYEPDTLTDNPFDTPGQYRAVFTITPNVGNTIPVIVEFATK